MNHLKYVLEIIVLMIFFLLFSASSRTHFDALLINPNLGDFFFMVFNFLAAVFCITAILNSWEELWK